MNFKKVCLFCGQQNNSSNYSCNCNKEEWSQQYRNLDIEIDLRDERETVLQSFYTYSFGNSQGMLQYRGLPVRDLPSENIQRVGVTPLYKLRHLGHRYGCTIYLKDEGDNPSGCFKDRETLLCLLNSRRQKFKKAVIYSSGNAAASAASLVENMDYRILTFLAGDTSPDKIDFICEHGSDVVVIGDERTSFEEGYRLFSRVNAENIFYEQRFDNWSVRNPYRVQGDKTTALEIVKQLSPDNGKTIVVPDFVLVPTANGSCLAGIWKGFRELNRIGLIPKLPGMISAGISHGNPVYRAVQQKETERPVRCDRSKVDPEDMEVGSTLIAEEGYDSLEAAKAVIESGGTALELHTSAVQKSLIDFLDREDSLAIEKNILPEPAALVSLAAVEKMREKAELSSSDIVVSISTGHGFRAMKMINQLLIDRIDLQYMVNHIATDRKNRMKCPAKKRKGEKIFVEANEDAVISSFSRLVKSMA